MKRYIKSNSTPKYKLRDDYENASDYRKAVLRKQFESNHNPYKQVANHTFYTDEQLRERQAAADNWEKEREKYFSSKSNAVLGSHDEYAPGQYTDFIDKDVSPEVVEFVEYEDDGDLKTLYTLLKRAYDEFISEYNEFPSPYDRSSIDVKYDEDKGRFYTKYLPFVNKCKEYVHLGDVSGYGGGSDVIKIKIGNMCNSVVGMYPHGWKYAATQKY